MGLLCTSFYPLDIKGHPQRTREAVVTAPAVHLPNKKSGAGPRAPATCRPWTRGPGTRAGRGRPACRAAPVRSASRPFPKCCPSALLHQPGPLGATRVAKGADSLIVAFAPSLRSRRLLHALAPQRGLPTGTVTVHSLASAALQPLSRGRLPQDPPLAGRALLSRTFSSPLSK